MSTEKISGVSGSVATIALRKGITAFLTAAVAGGQVGIAVRGHNKFPGDHGAMLGPQLEAIRTLIDGCHLGLFEDLPASFPDGRGEAANVVQRMDDARMGIQDAADKVARPSLGPRFVGIEDPQALSPNISASGFRLARPGRSRATLLWAHRRLPVFREAGAIDAAFRDVALDAVHRVVGQPVHKVGQVDPVAPEPCRLGRRDTSVETTPPFRPEAPKPTSLASRTAGLSPRSSPAGRLTDLYIRRR